MPQEITAWQRTPEPLSMSDYYKMISYGVKRLYVDTGRAQAYRRDLLTDMQELPPDEELYVLLVAQIAFFKRVQTDVNNIVSYTTDALSVANADKPYAHLQDTINDLENERRILFYKMVDYSFYHG